MSRKHGPRITRAQKMFFHKGLARAHIPFEMEKRVRGVSGREYTVDGVVEPKIIIEIDGGIHEKLKKQMKDLKRDRDLAAAGYTIIRFFNYEIYNNLAKCVSAVKQLRK